MLLVLVIQRVGGAGINGKLVRTSVMDVLSTPSSSSLALISTSNTSKRFNISISDWLVGIIIFTHVTETYFKIQSYTVVILATGMSAIKRIYYKLLDVVCEIRNEFPEGSDLRILSSNACMMINF